MSSKEYFKKKTDPYKPKIWENKNYIFPDEENFDKINKLYSDFLTSNYDDILLQFNKQNILNYRNEEGKTLINAVLENGDLTELQKKQIIEKLIHVKVSINAKDKYNQTSLHVACQYGYNSIIQLLIEKKALKNELDNYGNAPIHYYVENFIKNCNDYDVYNKNPNTLTPKRKKYLDIINNLLSIQIIDFIKKDPNIITFDKKISDLIKLIKFFEIKKINEEYDSFKKDIAFKSLENLSDLEEKNKMFKRFIQLKNNIFKIFDDKKNSITYLDKEQLDAEIDNQKNFIIKELKQNNKTLTEFNDFLIKKRDEISKAFNSISEPLFYLIFIQKYYRFTVNSYIVNDVAYNIAQHSKYIIDFVKNALDDDIVKNYSSGVKNAILAYNSGADTAINDVNTNKEILNIGILEIKKITVNQDVDINNLITNTETNANEDKQKVKEIIDNIVLLVNNSIQKSIEEKKTAVNSITSASAPLRTNITNNIAQIRPVAAVPTPQDLNVFLPLQIAKDAVSAVFLYDATISLFGASELFNTDKECIALKEGAEKSIKNAASAIYNYAKAYKIAIEINGGLNLGIDKSTVINLAQSGNLMNLFMQIPVPGQPDPAFQNNAATQLGISDLFGLFHGDYTNLIGGNDNYAPATIFTLDNYNDLSVYRLIRQILSDPLINQAAPNERRGIITLLAVKTLTDYIVNRNSVYGGNPANNIIVGRAFPGNRPNLIDRINALAANTIDSTAAFNDLDIAETMEIFAERIYQTIINTTDPVDLVKSSIDLLILTIFINNQQIPAPAANTDFSLVYASLYEFVSTSSLAYINSISSKINFFQVVAKHYPPFGGNPVQPPAGAALLRIIGTQAAQQDIKKILNSINSLKLITAPNIRNISALISPLINKATAQIATDIGAAQIIEPWALSTSVIFGIDSTEQTFTAIAAGAAVNLRNFIYINLNGYDKLIANRLVEIYPYYDTILDSQKRKEAWDKTLEKLITLPQKITKIELTKAKLDAIDVDNMYKAFKTKKDEIFGEVNIDMKELYNSSTKITTHSFLYYNHSEHIHVPQIIKKNDADNIVNGTEIQYLLNNMSTSFNNIFTDQPESIDFYDRKELHINYKYFNIHFLIDLINKYNISDIGLPADEKDYDDYFKEIKIETIFKIYSNYEKIICIINNLFLILNKIKEREKYAKNFSETLEGLKDESFFNYKIELEEPPTLSIKTDKKYKGKKKYKIEEGNKKYRTEDFETEYSTEESDKKYSIEKADIKYSIEKTDKKYSIEKTDKKYIIKQHGGVLQDYNKMFTDKIDKMVEALGKNELEEKVFNAIYEILTKIITNYNEVIEMINKTFSIKYLEYVRNTLLDGSTSKTMSLFSNRFMLLNNEEFPEKIETYFSKFINIDEKIIKQESIKKLFLKLNDFNYNKIYDNNYQPELDIDTYSLKSGTTAGGTIKENGKLYIEFDKEIEKNVLDDFIDGTAVPYADLSAYKFTTGYLTYYCEEIEPKDKIYKNFSSNIQQDVLGKYLYVNKPYKQDEDDMIIIPIFFYNLYMTMYYYKCIELLTKNSEGIFESLKCMFEEQYSRPSKETKRILKNFNNIIRNEEERNKILGIKFQEIMQNFINQKSVVETNKVLKLLFESDTSYKKIEELVKQDIYNKEQEYSIKPVEATLYLLDNFKEENDDYDRVYSTKIISKTCLNNSCIQKINEFKFNLRLPDKNGNTVIHRLVDQLNERGIQVLLSQDPAIITYKNNNNQTPLEYLLDNYKITRKLYDEKEIEKRVNELVLDIDKDIIIENKSKWSHRDTKAIFYNCLYQFNEFIWLKLYEFKNNITLENINNLIAIIKDNYTNIKEGLLITEININDIQSKLERILNQNNKKNKLEDELYNSKCKELNDLSNRISNLKILKESKTYDNIDDDITKLEEEYNRKNAEKIEIDKFIKLFNTSQQSKIDTIICTINEKKMNIEKKLLLNVNDILNDLSKKLEEDYLKILHILYDIKLKDGSEYLCDFNKILMTINIQDLEKNKDIKKIDAYQKYFKDHLNPIFEDFNDLEKLEDYTVNYVNIEILNIIYVNIVYTIAYEIYNSLLQYLFDKYADNLQKNEGKDKQTSNKKVIIKNIKLFLKNKLFDKLSIKNKDKNYETNEFYIDNIIELFIQFINNKLEDDDKKAMEQIIDFYSKILENISDKFYNEIKDYLTNQRKIILLLKIYDVIKDAERNIK